MTQELKLKLLSQYAYEFGMERALEILEDMEGQ